VNSLSKIVAEIKENAPFANLALETVSPKMRVGMEGRKNAATARIVELKKEYGDAVWKNALFIAPVNYKSKEMLVDFVQLADSIGECMPVDYLAWDKQVGLSWWNANGNRAQTIDTVHTIQLLDAIRKTASELNLTEVRTPEVPRQIALNTLEDCVATVKDVTTKFCGVDFRVALLKKEVADVAEKLEWSGDDTQSIPFVVVNATPEDVEALSPTGKFFKVGMSAVSEVSEEYVQKTLEKIAKSNKKSK
jgi:hypothetical protein